MNWENPRVREALKKVILFWKKKGIRGFRFDVVNLISKPEIYEDDHEGDGRRFYSDGPHIHEYLKELTRDTGIEELVTVGEMSSTRLEACARYSNPQERELSMCFHFHHLKVDYRDGDKWALMEPDRWALKKLFEQWQTGMQSQGGWSALFWCNHDQPRIVSRFGDEGRYWKESAKMLAASIHLMRGTPYIYQGEELGKTKEEALAILAARSRDNSRTPMQWSSETYGGFSEKEPWIAVQDSYHKINAAAQRYDDGSIFSFYKKLIALRREKAVISQGSIAFLAPDNADVLAYRRQWEGEELVVLNNLTAEETTVTAEPAWTAYRKILGNYEDTAAGAEGQERPAGQADEVTGSRPDRMGERMAEGRIVLRPYETVVLEK